MKKIWEVTFKKDGWFDMKLPQCNLVLNVLQHLLAKIAVYTRKVVAFVTVSPSFLAPQIYTISAVSVDAVACLRSSTVVISTIFAVTISQNLSYLDLRALWICKSLQRDELRFPITVCVLRSNLTYCFVSVAISYSVISLHIKGNSTGKIQKDIIFSVIVPAILLRVQEKYFVRASWITYNILSIRFM